MKTNTLAALLASLALASTAVSGIGVTPAIAAPVGDSASPVAEATILPTEPPAVTPTQIPATPGVEVVPSAPNSPTNPPATEPQNDVSGLDQVTAAATPTAPDAAQRPSDGGAVMGQAGQVAPQSSAKMAQPLSASSEPAVGEQPAGTEGKPLGLDVSGWQKNVDWTTVKNSGARFAYIKTSEGPWTLNDYFAQQYNGAANVGLLRGGYHFARPNLSSGSSQAKVMLESGGGWSGDGKTLPPALDIEDNPYVSTDKTNKCYGMTPAALVNWVKDFTSTIKASTGRDPVIYSSYYFWQECFGSSNAFANSNPLWIAAYYASSPWMPGQWPKYTIWQYANGYADQAQTRLATFPGDQNVFNGTMDDLRELASGTKKPVIGLIPGATVISGKWAGDGKTYVGWFKDSQWCLEMPSNTRRCFYFGAAGDKPVVGDWDGDGTATIGIVRSGVWQLTNNLSSLSVDLVQYFGVGTDTPITGDWNGDRKATIGIFRNGSWQVTNSQARGPKVDVSAYFGVGTDTPVVGDWNGDKWDTFGVWRNGIFWLTDSQLRPPVNYVFRFGVGTDRPTTGDWNGDGKTSVGIVRDGTWQLTNDLKKLSVDSVRF
ncbi:GH25 family lysozyme [Arthrobacter sp. TWP1-1]|uniref:GH25 family lysozyme n=1 Tax=Arthrobacter sp. TWP1-1 TaxID=2804568 RepID=UPI003CF24246